MVELSKEKDEGPQYANIGSLAGATVIIPVVVKCAHCEGTGICKNTPRYYNDNFLHRDVRDVSDLKSEPGKSCSMCNSNSKAQINGDFYECSICKGTGWVAFTGDLLRR